MVAILLPQGSKHEKKAKNIAETLALMYIL